MSKKSDEEGTTLLMPTSTKKTACAPHGAPNNRVHPMHDIVDGEASPPHWHLLLELEENWVKSLLGEKGEGNHPGSPMRPLL